MRTNIQNPINTLLWKNVRMDDALYVYLQFLPSLVVYFLACHLCISSFLVIMCLHFFWPIIPAKFFFFSIAYYFPQNTEIHGRRCTSINCKGGAAGFIRTFTTWREHDFGLYLVVSSPDPTYERGSGDIWLISQASLMLITFRTEISLRQSHCRKDNCSATPEILGYFSTMT